MRRFPKTVYRNPLNHSVILTRPVLLRKSRALVQWGWNEKTRDFDKIFRKLHEIFEQVSSISIRGPKYAQCSSPSVVKYSVQFTLIVPINDSDSLESSTEEMRENVSILLCTLDLSLWCRRIPDKIWDLWRMNISLNRHVNKQIFKMRWWAT